MINGLNHSDILEISNQVKKFPEIQSVFLFGSRAKGNFKAGSDVDLALFGDTLDAETTLKLSYYLNEETNMPYQFDVLNYHTLAEQPLKDHIIRVGIKIYP